MFSIRNVLGVAFFAVTLILVLVNGLAMPISPRRFFSLPSWVRAQGSLTRERYTSGWGGLQLRILGGVFVAGVVWFALALFGFHTPMSVKVFSSSGIPGRMTLAISMIAVFVYGGTMLILPRWFVSLPTWLRGSLPPEIYTSRAGALAIRILGGAFVATVVWFAVSFFGVVR